MVLTCTPRGTKTVVLRKNIDEVKAMAMTEQKKTSPFRSLLSRPTRGQIHVHSLKLYYECFLRVSGRYVADYYRKATHTISVDHNVGDVVLGDGLFPARSKSGLAKTFSGKRGKNKIDLRLEEHVFVDSEDMLIFDHHGNRAKFPFRTDSKVVENYPKRVLERNAPNIRELETTREAVLKKLQIVLKKPVDTDVRDLNDKFVLLEATNVYVPVFEARLIGPKKKIKIIRIDAVRKKFL